MVRKHTKICPVPLVPTTVDLQVILNQVLGKYKIHAGAYIIIISNSAHTITSFRFFAIDIIKMNLDWKNCHHSEAHPSRECRGLPLSPSRYLRTWGCIQKSSWKLLSSYIGLVSNFRNFFFFLFFFFPRKFTNQRTVGEGGGHFFNSSLPLSPASQTLRH